MQTESMWLRPLVGFVASLVLAGATPAFAGAVAAQQSPRNADRCVPHLEGPVPVPDSAERYRPPGAPPPPEGWVEEEYFVSCDALGDRYRTTLTVRRPTERAELLPPGPPDLRSTEPGDRPAAEPEAPRRGEPEEGVVIVEPTHPGNIWPVLSTAREYLARAGHVQVAVSTTPSVVEGLVKPTDPDRYADLEVPDIEGIADEILAQVGLRLRLEGLPPIDAGTSDDADDPGAPDDADDAGASSGAGGAGASAGAPADTPQSVGHLILAGYSGTAAMVRSYIAARHEEARLPDGSPIYQGYFPGQTAVGTRPGPIPDLDVPVLEVQGEREIIATIDRNPEGLAYRRPDSEHYRLWEVPGMAHLDTRGTERGWETRACRIDELSRFPLAHVWDAALHRLVVWVRTGEPPPRAERIRLEPDGRTVARDRHGNALGGVPTPYLEVPVATYHTVSEPRPDAPSSARCDMVGPQHRFDRQTLRELYGDRESFLERFDRRLDELVAEGWYLAYRADELRREARDLPEFGRP